MKRRLLSLLLVMALCLSLGITAFASGEADVNEEITEAGEIAEDQVGEAAEEEGTPVGEESVPVSTAAEEPVDDADPAVPVADGADIEYSGTCGSGLTWTLDSDGVLTVSGTGAMDDYYTYTSGGRTYTNASWYSRRDRIVKVVIEPGVTTIGDLAFYDCGSLTSVTIGNSVTSIGDDAFYNCSSLKSVTIGSSVTSIGDKAFYKCSSLASINIPGSVTSIGDGTFRYCDSLTAITIPDSVTSIGNYVFAHCSDLTSVTIPDSVTSFGYSEFSDCPSLVSVTIGNGVTSIESSTFENCVSLTSVTIPDSVTSIGDKAFDGCSSLASITIPESVTSIGDYAFRSCTSLESFTIPEGVTYIGGNAFSGCSNLKSVTIPESVTDIGGYAFRGCSSLESVEIPDGVTSIGGYAFYNCTSLTSITIPISVTYIGGYAFSGCSSLTDLYYGGTRDDWGNIKVGTLSTEIRRLGTDNSYINAGMGALLRINIHCIGDGFTAEVDGWPVFNTAETFGYPDGYRINLGYYFNTEGFSISSAVNGIFNSKWEGSCFGLSLLAAANYNGQIDLSGYFDNSGSTLNTYGYDGIEYVTLGSYGSGNIYTIRGTDAVEMIERAQVSQYSSEFKKTEVFKGDSDYSELLEYLNGSDPLPLVVTIEAPLSGGHTVVLDTSRKPVDQGDGTYLIYVYDSNVPQLTNTLSGALSRYGWEESCLRIDTSSGNWAFYENGKSVMSGSYKALYTIYIRFYDVSKLSTEFFYGSGTLADNLTTFSSAALSVEDENSNVVFEMDDTGIYQYEDVDYTPYVSGTGDDPVTSGYIILPAGEYTFRSEGETSVVRMCEDDYIAAWEADAAVTVTIDDETRSVLVENTGGAETEITAAIQNADGSVAASAGGTLDAGAEMDIQLVTEKDGTETVKISTTGDPDRITTEIIIDGEEINAHTPGDVNGDGRVNISDVQTLLKHVNGQSVSVNDAALDVNGDSTVNISDVQTLLKYVNGQNVTIY